MAKKIYVKVDTIEGIVSVKYGRFGAVTDYSNGWYSEHSINEIVKDFCKQTALEYQRALMANVK